MHRDRVGTFQIVEECFVYRPPQTGLSIDPRNCRAVCHPRAVVTEFARNVLNGDQLAYRPVLKLARPEVSCARNAVTKMQTSVSVSSFAWRQPPIPPFPPAGRERVDLCRQGCRPKKPWPTSLWRAFDGSRVRQG